MEEQYAAVTVAQVAASEQSLMNQNTASAMRTLASQRGDRKGRQEPSKLSSAPTQGGARGDGSRGRKPYSRPAQSETAPTQNSQGFRA